MLEINGRQTTSDSNTPELLRWRTSAKTAASQSAPGTRCWTSFQVLCAACLWKTAYAHTHVTHTRTHTRTHAHTQLGSLIWVEMTSNDLQSLNLNGITLRTSFWFSTELERPASPRHICAVTRGFQTTTQDVSVFRFLPRHYHMTRVLLSPFITTVCTPVVLAIINII